MNTEPMKPVGKRLLLQMDPPEEKVGSIHIPKNSQETHSWGSVVEISKDLEDEFEAGDRVLIADHFGTHYTMRSPGSGDKQDFIIIERRHCLAIEKLA